MRKRLLALLLAVLGLFLWADVAAVDWGSMGPAAVVAASGQDSVTYASSSTVTLGARTFTDWSGPDGVLLWSDVAYQFRVEYVGGANDDPYNLWTVIPGEQSFTIVGPVKMIEFQAATDTVWAWALYK